MIINELTALRQNDTGVLVYGIAEGIRMGWR
ncbi:MAG: hypothetical protein ACJAVZ_002122 [Afipia broomeae]|jgi:hypothetical protein|uniref:Uncharacterized protein n=1 Tax=Afipia broomeae ATCC 49717 TaxID=883078 RepID=K8PF18_9BRAD|nr:hypothetical protein HMPREF9695_03391 [Afipia broomeae ATCC 49717]